MYKQFITQIHSKLLPPATEANTNGQQYNNFIPQGAHFKGSSP